MYLCLCVLWLLVIGDSDCVAPQKVRGRSCSNLRIRYLMTNHDIDIGSAVTTVKHNSWTTRYMLHVLVGSRSTTGGKPGKHNVLQLYYQYIITVDTSGGSRIYRAGWFPHRKRVRGHHFFRTSA